MSEHFPLEHFLNIPKDSTPNVTNLQTLSPPCNKNLFDNLPQNQAQGDFNAEELESINKKIMEKLKDQISEIKYNTFFNSTFSLLSLSNNTIEFAASTEYIRTVIRSHYLSYVENAVEQVLGERYEMNISVISTNKVFTPERTSFLDYNKQKNISVDSSTKKATAKDASFTIDLVPTKEDKLSSVNSRVINYPDHKKFKILVDPKKTFDNFVVGPSNNMAYASAQAVAKAPGKAYPCLYVHSNSGLGKTHLLHSVANKVKETSPQLIICITTARDFMNEMVDYQRRNEIFIFRKKYSEEIDLLMIDDIHELKNKEGTQNEFFHVFNELHNKGKQLIFTSDKHPKDINGVEERIKTRLAWGLVLDIQPPDLETRIAILKNKAVKEDIFLSQDVINLIAVKVKSNIRELEGSLIRLAAYSGIFDIDIDIEIAKEQLNLIDGQEQDALTIDAVTLPTSRYFNVPLADIKSKSRLKNVTQARHVAMYLAHNLIKPSPTYMEIGTFFGGRDHSSVLHAIEKIRSALKTDQTLSQAILEIENEL